MMKACKAYAEAKRKFMIEIHDCPPWYSSWWTFASIGIEVASLEGSFTSYSMGWSLGFPIDGIPSLCEMRAFSSLNADHNF